MDNSPPNYPPVPLLPPELAPKSDVTREVEVIDRDFGFESGAIKGWTLRTDLGDEEVEFEDHFVLNFHFESGTTERVRVYKRALAWDAESRHTIVLENETEIQSPEAVARQDLSGLPNNEPLRSPDLEPSS